MTRFKGLVPLIAAAAVLGGCGIWEQAVNRYATFLAGGMVAPGLKGDPAGSGGAEITTAVGTSRICYRLEVSNIAPATAAHIHHGAHGLTGPEVLALSPPIGGKSNGCGVAAKSVFAQIAARPEDFYVDVHNGPYPGGALRGSLHIVARGLDLGF